MWCGRDVDSPERVCSAEVSCTRAGSELHGERQLSCTEAGDAVGHRGTARLQRKYCTVATHGLPGIQQLHRRASADEDPAGTVGCPWEHTPSSLCPPRAMTCIQSHGNGSGDIRLSSYGLLSIAGVLGSRGDLAVGPRPRARGGGGGATTSAVDLAVDGAPPPHPPIGRAQDRGGLGGAGQGNPCRSRRIRRRAARAGWHPC